MSPEVTPSSEVHRLISLPSPTKGEVLEKIEKLKEKGYTITQYQNALKNTGDIHTIAISNQHGIGMTCRIFGDTTRDTFYFGNEDRCLSYETTRLNRDYSASSIRLVYTPGNFSVSEYWETNQLPVVDSEESSVKKSLAAGLKTLSLPSDIPSNTQIIKRIFKGLNRGYQEIIKRGIFSEVVKKDKDPFYGL